MQFKTASASLGFSMSNLINPYIEVTGTLIRLSPTPVIRSSLAVWLSRRAHLYSSAMSEGSGATGNVCAAPAQGE